MRFKLRALMAGAFLIGAGAVASAQGTVYVKADGTSLREGTSLGGPTVAELRAGTRLTVVEEDRLRLRVRTPDGREGYVTTRQVQTSPPASGGSGLGGLVRDDRSASELRTAASGRGLAEQARDMARDGEIDQRAVEDAEAMERLSESVSDSDVDSFLRQGGMNP